MVMEIPEITEGHLKTIRNISKRISNSTGVDWEELYGEGLEKFPRLFTNFRGELGKPFSAYMAICMRGWMLNYCRDKSFLSTVKRSHLYLYTQSKKFDNLKQAADALMVPESLLTQISTQVKNSRRYNSVDITNEWQVPLPDEVFTSEARLLLVDLLDENEVALLEDIYLNNANEGDLVETYGPKYSDLVDYLLAKLDNHREVFLEWLT